MEEEELTSRIDRAFNIYDTAALHAWGPVVLYFVASPLLQREINSIMLRACYCFEKAVNDR